MISLISDSLSGAISTSRPSFLIESIKFELLACLCSFLEKTIIFEVKKNA